LSRDTCGDESVVLGKDESRSSMELVGQLHKLDISFTKGRNTHEDR